MSNILKKLLICSQSHNLYGGVENIVNDLCLELPKRGWDTILGLGKGSCYNRVDLYRNEYPNIPIIEIDGSKGTRQSRFEALVKIFQAVKPDIILSARLFDAYWAINQLKKRNQRIYFAVTIQAYEPPYFYDIGLFKKTVDLCITSGNLVKEAVIHLSKLHKDKVISIPGGVRSPKTVVKPRRLRKLLKIGYVGRLEQGQKRIFDLIPFLKKLDQIDYSFQIDIVGCGPEEKELKKKLREQINKGCVIFHGWQKRSALYNTFYPEMDCLVHFAHTEGITIAPREAMAHGVVPIISQFTGLLAESHFVHDINALTFPVGDINLAVANVQRLITSRGLLEFLSSNALKSQEGVYSFEGSMDAWAHALNKCLEHAPATGTKRTIKRQPDGRLTRYGLSPWLAQRIRDLFRKRHIHRDPGSEWPTQSGLMSLEAQTEILHFARQFEKRYINKEPEDT